MVKKFNESGSINIMYNAPTVTEIVQSGRDGQSDSKGNKIINEKNIKYRSINNKMKKT